MSFSPADPLSYKWAGPSGLFLVSRLLDLLRYQRHLLLKYLGVVGSRPTPCSTSATSTVDPRLAVEIHRPPRGLPKLADSQLRVRIYLFFYNPLSHLSSTPCLLSFPRMGLRQYKMCLDVVTTSSTSIERTGVIILNSNLSLAIYSLPQ